MRIGKKRARFTIKVLDNKSGKSKSFVFDNNIKKANDLAELIQELLKQHYQQQNG